MVSEVSGPHLGAMFGLLNSVGVIGAYTSPVFLGYLVDHLHKLGYVGRQQWDPAFYVYGGLLLIGAIGWLFVDPRKRVTE